MGGEIGDPNDGYRRRCRNTPRYIITEDEPGEDGQRGSMSLCRSCRDVFVEQMGESGYTFHPTTATRGPACRQKSSQTLSPLLTSRR